MTLPFAYLNNRLQLEVSPQEVLNKGAHVIVCGETYCYSNLSLGHGTVHYTSFSEFTRKLMSIVLIYITVKIQTK